MRDGLSPNGTTGTGSGSTGTALSTLYHPRQLSDLWQGAQLSKLIETQLEKERDKLPLWVPVALGCGIASWFNLANPAWWLAFISLCGGIALLDSILGA